MNESIGGGVVGDGLESNTTEDDPPPHRTVALGRFPVVLERGLTEILLEDPTVSIIETGRDAQTLSRMAAHGAMQVAVIHEPAVGSSVLNTLGLRRHEVGLVVLVDHPTQSQVLRVLGAGAGCISPRTSPEGIRETLHAAAEGLSLFTGESDRRMEGGATANFDTLTPREREVLGCLAEGRTNDQAALLLGVAPNTIRVHSARIREKLGVKSKRDLIGITVSLNL